MGPEPRSSKDRLEQAGLFSTVVRQSDVTDFARQKPGSRWVCIVRDPYARTISAYKSKVQRYAKKFRPGEYYRAALLRYFRHPRTWDDSRIPASLVANRIPFDEFLEGLQENGVNWDSHFQLQTRTLAIPEMTYDLIIQLEKLDEGLTAVCQMIGAPVPEGILKNRLNQSLESDEGHVQLTPARRKTIWRLYQRDFELLGYNR